MKRIAFFVLFTAFLASGGMKSYSQEGYHGFIDNRESGHGKLSAFSDETRAITTFLLQEDFSGGTFPPAGWTIVGDGQNNWSAENSNNAGGSSPEAMFSWSPQFEGNSKFVTPIISTVGMTKLLLEFKHMLDHYGGDYSILVETTSDGITWNEAWSIVNPSSNAGPETIALFIDNDDVGSASFQFCFTFTGNSYNLDYWYIDNVLLSESLAYDAASTVIMIPGFIPAGDTVTPGAVISNYGTETISFDVTFEVLQNSNPQYTSILGVSGLEPLESINLSFDPWITVEGSYSARVITLLAGDENPSNDTLYKSVEVVEGAVLKKPLFEVFTASTCDPCASVNPIIDEVLENNPGEYSLIKYQMDWPSGGDPYYTEQGGVRKEYYGVGWVPDFYGNGDQDDGGNFTQIVFDTYAEQLTLLTIDATASIDQDYIVSYEAIINPVGHYSAGLKAHVCIVENTTVGNYGNNGETEFHNVMLSMIPDAYGTALGEIFEGVPIELTGTCDMNQSFMEEPVDLSLIVFIQDDLSKEVIQSQMVDVEALGFVPYSVTFNVVDNNGNPVNNAEVKMDAQSLNFTNSSGQAYFPVAYPNSYDYRISKAGLEVVVGTLTVINENLVIDITLNDPSNFLLYEDFTSGSLPSGWTSYYSGSNEVYWALESMVLYRGQPAGDIWLISPQIDLAMAEKIYIEAGMSHGNPLPAMVVGTLPGPSDTASFSELASIVTSENGFDWYEIDLSDYTGSDTYIGWTYDGPNGWYVIETVKVTAEGTGIEPEYSAANVLVYPNPAKDYIHIQSEESINSIRLLNNFGQLTEFLSISGNAVRIPLGSLASGIYILVIQTESQTITKKVCID